MRNVLTRLLFIAFIFMPYSAWAILSMELTQGVAGAIPIAVVPFGREGGTPPQDVSAIIGNDLASSGRFKVVGANQLTQFPSRVETVSSDYFKRIGTDHVVVGEVKLVGYDQYQVTFQLLNMYHGSGRSSVAVGKKFTVSGGQLRALSHHISDIIYQQITGVRGVFSTRIAYIVVQRTSSGANRYILEVADQDGYNAHPLLNSPEPLMSPAWSPNGRQLAYVSFENHHASIYVQDVVSGARRLISEFPGINGAPAWSPNGRKLALVLSKSGSPNIYILDTMTRQLTQLTNDFYINTEPAWSPDGKSLLFTSNRSGGPQIYQMNLATNAVSRISYDGDYNARASYTRDGSHVVMIHRASGTYNIAVLDLDTGTVRIISNSSSDSDSPSVAPNGTMILYDTISGGHSTLAMVSSDGRTRLLLPTRNGEAQDPAWSPFLS